MHYKNPKILNKTSCKFITILTLAIANILCGLYRADAQAQSKPAAGTNNSLFDNIFNNKSRPKKIPNWLEKEAEYKADKAAGFDSAKHYVGELLEVINGDTIRALVDGVKVDIRTQYNDAPELDQPMGQESKAYLQSLLGRPGSQFSASPSTVAHEFGREPTYNRPLASIRNNKNQDVVSEMLRAGMTSHAYADHSLIQESLSNLHGEAGNNCRGIHQYTDRGSPPIWPSEWRQLSQSKKDLLNKERELAKRKEKPKDISPEPLEEDSSINPIAIGLGIGTVLGGTILASRAYNHSVAKKRTLLKRRAEYADDDE